MNFETFFKPVLEHVPKEIESLVVVTHMVPGVDDFLLSVNSKLEIAAVIPKPNSIKENVLQRVEEEGIPMLRYTRDEIIAEPIAFLGALSENLRGRAFAIIDTGGYFSHVLPQMACTETFNLIGIVEDTENGLQKYESLLLSNSHSMDRFTSFPCPIVSVARSALKGPEDFLVGQAVVFSADALLRESAQILTGKEALVIGYGKIGSSIATNLRAKGVRVNVFDSNPAKRALALAHGHRTGDRTHLIQQADLLFCATGNKSLLKEDFFQMKRGAYIFTATSGDDEIANYHEIITNSIFDSNRRVSTIDIKGARVFLCNKGHSVNFMHGGIVGPFIKLVQAELIFALSHLPNLRNVPCDGVRHLSDGSKEFIAELWLKSFLIMAKPRPESADPKRDGVLPAAGPRRAASAALPVGIGG